MAAASRQPGQLALGLGRSLVHLPRWQRVLPPAGEGRLQGPLSPRPGHCPLGLVRRRPCPEVWWVMR